MVFSLTEYQQELQEKRHWCWAATIQSLVRFYFRNDPGNAVLSITQCAIVQDVLGPVILRQRTCCQATTPATWPPYLEAPPGNTAPATWDDQSPCNVKAPNDPKLQEYLAWRFDITYDYVERQLPADKIEEQLKAGWPVFIVRSDGDEGAHILAITGIDGTMLTIQDSQGDVKTAKFENLAKLPTQDSRILTSGKGGAVRLYHWVRTYFHVQSR